MAKAKKPPAKTEREYADLHALSLRQFRAGMESTMDERDQSVEDRAFHQVAGAQWTGPLEDQWENKPRLEINKVQQAMLRIFNAYRANRMDVLFAPRDGSPADDLCDAISSLFRADEADSCAEEGWDNAFDETAAGGVGAIRLRACYVDDEDYGDEAGEDDERQQLRWEPIFEADRNVVWDADSKLADKSDAKHVFVLTAMTHDGYKEEYGEDPASWPLSLEKWQWQWTTQDVVYVAEKYELEQVRDTIEFWRNLASGDEKRFRKSLTDMHEGWREKMRIEGWKLDRSKRVSRRRVHKWLMNGSHIIQDCGYIAGKCLPVIQEYGKRAFIEDQERWSGHVRLAKDAQRVKNVMVSKLTEIAGRNSIEKPIVHPEEIKGYEQMWADDNITDYPYLVLNPLKDVSGNPIYGRQLSYTKPPNIPPALAALLQITDEDLKEILGNQQQAEQLQPNMSAQLMELVQTRIDEQCSIYIDGLKKAKKRAGEVWLSAAREIYVEEGRKLKGIDRSGEKRQIVVGKQTVDDRGVRVAQFDLSEGDLGVEVEVGPTTRSRRVAIVRVLIELLSAVDDPEDKKVLVAMILANMEGEGLGDMRKYFRRRLIKMGVVEPTPEEQAKLDKEAANQPPDPNAEYLKAAAGQADAEAKQATAGVLLKIAQADKAGAEAAKIKSETDHQQQTQALEVIDRVTPNLLPAQPAEAAASTGE